MSSDLTAEKRRCPLLSINIPTFNRLPLLKEALSVLLPQVTDDVEICVTDNHSYDGTWEFLETISDKVFRVRPPANTDGNLNILSCVNIGQGEYCWIHCDDDIAAFNAVASIIEAITSFNLPPALFLQWEGYDSAMSGFVNGTVPATWSQCDKNQFLRKVGYKFTFASGIVVRRGSVDLDYVQTHSPTALIPANIIFSTVARHNCVVVPNLPLIAARGTPAAYDALSVFSKQTWQLFRMNETLDYDPAVLRWVYGQSLTGVMVYAARFFPISFAGLVNVFRYSFTYQAFYTHVVPTLVKRLIKAITLRFRSAGQIVL